MITVTEAVRLIGENTLTLPITEVTLTAANGSVLREPISADRDFPPFHRVSMDGIAIRFANFQAGEDTFRIEGVQLAGAPPQTLHQNDGCLEVMTGAILPGNTDTVIRYEDLKIFDRNGIRYAHIFAAPKGRMQNVHQRGSDRQAADLLIPAGTLLSPAEIAVIATVGKTTVQVSQPLRVAIISTGDELVEVTEMPLPHQIRQSNSYLLQAALQEQGVKAQRFHLRDDKAALLTELKDLLSRFDALILSGGVSKGKADFIPEVLAELGVQKLFHEVAQRPGKPFWFGRVANGPVVFALPGNPVSTFVCFYKYVRPWVRASLSAPAALVPKAILQEETVFRPDLTYFLPVKVAIGTSGMLTAKPVHIGGSGDFAALLSADGFLELPQKQSTFSVGEVYAFYGFRS
ncbi:molybdopterin molybdotransferase MoeA [Adhaeribacter rhizoryzae]|uniref:Molybdopterin molybdenumtransferase n=1 Tax=Adhaeribacter rhizoryzae TaxID=2607907 RepID=A0A5M6D7H6_9BACT|nr:molybdopterin molybdotransferase MoeA [Adhaeribacter rhizoryzae]KAA5543333.1 molybdopterin molybdotransferase MoeA [Adhaeribacter rhizoryzae]